MPVLRHRGRRVGGTPRDFWFIFQTGLDVYLRTEKRVIGDVLDEINDQLGNGFHSMTIQRWMREKTIPKQDEVEYLAKKITSVTELDRGWVQILYNAAGYDTPVFFNHFGNIKADKQPGVSNADLISEGRTNTFTNLQFLQEQSATVFISYARVDVPIVQGIYKSLIRKKHRPWMDVYSIKGGENWLRAIHKGIDECEIFLAILSNNSVSRRGVIQKELKQALDIWAGMQPGDIYIIPVRIDNCLIPELLQDFQVIDWEDGKGSKKLTDAIEIGLVRRMISSL